MFTTRTAQLRHRHGGSPEVLYAVEYTHLPADRTSRWDWADTPQGRDTIIATARRRADNGEAFATYHRPAEEVWQLIYDDLPADADAAIDAEIAREFPGTREEQATAKLRELIRERNNLRQEQVNRETAHAEALARMQSRLDAALAPITDPSDERVANIWEQAAQVATSEGFCSEYDQLAARLGIPGRPRMRRGVVNVSFNVYAYAHAADENEAIEAMEERVRELVASVEVSAYGGNDGDVSHLDITEVDVDTDSVEVYE